MPTRHESGGGGFRRSPSADRIPIAEGWFLACFSHELRAGTPVRIVFGGQLLTAVRNGDRSVRVCDTNGRILPTEETAGAVFFFHSRSGSAPSWRIEPFDAPSYRTTESRYVNVAAPTHLLDVNENAFDLAHIESVHGADTLPEIREMQFDGPVMRAVLDTSTSRDRLAGSSTVRIRFEGLGVARFDITGPVDMTLLFAKTPVSHGAVRIRVRVTHEKLDDPAVTDAVLAFAAAHVEQELEQDVAIWRHKIYCASPVLTEAERPIADYRRWAAQFVDTDRDADAAASLPRKDLGNGDIDGRGFGVQIG